MYSRFEGRALQRADLRRPAIGSRPFMGNHFLGLTGGNYTVQREQFAASRPGAQLQGDALTVTKLEFLLRQPSGRSHAFERVRAGGDPGAHGAG
ncbi:MAG: hypothetical protein R3A48_00360 [Polyangiales bacterium]